jgi:hypothetical protein
MEDQGPIEREIMSENNNPPDTNSLLDSGAGRDDSSS